ncbi:MAG TPA: TIGR02266 family protein [Spirochaetota bacterium]|nr:TIGR02266 family protein [Spirochaetota bacterium]
MTDKKPDKRNEERIKKTVRSEVRSDETFTYSSTVDVSRGGIFISTPEPLGSGSRIELSIAIPGDGEVSIHGVVKWIREDEAGGCRAGMGIEFQNMDDTTKKKLGALIK